ncbi:MAG: hypothetical protein AB1489_07430 [Acidobacteriota bacterium]
MSLQNYLDLKQMVASIRLPQKMPPDVFLLLPNQVLPDFDYIVRKLSQPLAAYLERNATTRKGIDGRYLLLLTNGLFLSLRLADTTVVEVEIVEI